MKKIILLASCLIGLASAQAQYLQTAKAGRQWYVTYQGWFTVNVIYEVGPKINYQGGQHPLILVKDANLVLQDTLGVLVEDTVTGTVTINYFSIAPFSNRDSAFSYSFSQSVGDTMLYTVRDSTQISLTLDSVFSFTDFRGVTRRVLRYLVPEQNTSYETSFDIVEGIGPLTDWANPVFDGTYTDFPSINTRCVFDGALKIYGNTIVNCQVLGQEEFSAPRLTVYPNPVTQQLFIQGLSPDEWHSAEIFNLQGQRVLQTGAINLGIDVEQLASGTYYLLLRQNSGRVAKAFFVKQ